MIIEEKLEGQRGIEMRKILGLWNIRQWIGLYNIQTLIYTARNKEAMENVMTNIH